MKKPILCATNEITVRFSEVDSLGIVWHGHHVKYFEDGRVAFGDKYDLDYMDVYRKGYVVPIVHMECDYKSPLRYKDRLVIETTYVDCDAVKLLFTYRIINKESGKVAATGSSTQVLLDTTGNLIFTMPPFLEEWKKRWKLR